MKSIVYIIFIALCGCRAMKETRTASYRTADQRQSKEEWRHTLLFRQQDSTTRYWYFATDSLFYFHPDSGLYSRSGTLWSAEDRRKEFLLVQSTDSLSAQSQVSTADGVLATKKITRKYSMLVVLVVLLVVGVWFWWRVSRLRV